jgi:asparagine synthase (glutamine-hydrolysing)
MCGICGIVARHPLADRDRERVARMNAAMVHRGPDGDGAFDDANVAMAMRRLSIIDLAGGWQPLYNEDRTLALVANGEIYNFVELRSQLESRGHRFATGSDCETIVHLYEEHGTDCVCRLRGMFAFALWDGRRRRLMLARDRMGEKPLYLHERDGQLLFASELKALLRSGAVPFELNAPAINLYFHYQYVPEPPTPIEGVHKLPAGHLLTVDTEDWRLTQTCYWRMEDAPPIDDDPAAAIRAELEAVSELVIRSDVPVGVALSGGLDSSAIAALAVRKYPGKMHAFSVGYPGRPTYDERAAARELADHLGMPLHEIELGVDDMTACFPDLVGWRDDPIADISGYGYYSVAKLAREHDVPVMLQGQGGDELFWGYSWVRQAVAESMQKAARRREPGGPSADSPAAMVFYDLAPDFRMARDGAADLFTKQFAETCRGVDPCGPFTFAQPWPRVDLRMTRLICDTYLAENGIAQGDRLSMASSVELRLPLVDYRLVETVIGLRKTHPDHEQAPKAWLKAAMAGVLPESVLDRPKQGFAPPLRTWHNAIFAAYGTLLEDGDLVRAGVLRPEAARALAAGPFPRGAVVPLSFKALVLEYWCRRMKQAAAGMETELRERTPDAHCAVCV